VLAALRAALRDARPVAPTDSSGESSRRAEVRLAAAVALGNLKQPADEVLSDLLPLLDDPDVGVRRTTAEALGRLANPGAVACLRSALHDAEEAVRALSAEALGRIGAPAAAAAPDLVRLLRDARRRVRREAATALGRIQAANPDVLAGLEQAAQDEDKGVRTQAAQALRKLRAAGSPKRQRGT
jgi:HEAT repeat protein